jgi:hypothetical protein
LFAFQWTHHHLITSTQLHVRRPDLLSLLPPRRKSIKDTPIIYPPNILLHHAPICRPKHQIRCNPYCIISPSSPHPNFTRPQTLTFKERTTPPNRICNTPLPLEDIPHIPNRQIIPPLCVFRKYILELLRHEPPFMIICPRIAAMFVLMHVFQVEAEERIR